jgi:hypothetical protein
LVYDSEKNGTIWNRSKSVTWVTVCSNPVRLRGAAVPAERLRQLAAGFDAAIELFGLQEWAGKIGEMDDR